MKRAILRLEYFHHLYNNFRIGIKAFSIALLAYHSRLHGIYVHIEEITAGFTFFTSIRRKSSTMRWQKSFHFCCVQCPTVSASNYCARENDSRGYCRSCMYSVQIFALYSDDVFLPGHLHRPVPGYQQMWRKCIISADSSRGISPGSS